MLSCVCHQPPISQVALVPGVGWLSAGRLTPVSPIIHRRFSLPPGAVPGSQSSRRVSSRAQACCTSHILVFAGVTLASVSHRAGSPCRGLPQGVGRRKCKQKGLLLNLSVSKCLFARGMKEPHRTYGHVNICLVPALLLTQQVALVTSLLTSLSITCLL